MTPGIFTLYRNNLSGNYWKTVLGENGISRWATVSVGTNGVFNGPTALDLICEACYQDPTYGEHEVRVCNLSDFTKVSSTDFENYKYEYSIRNGQAYLQSRKLPLGVTYHVDKSSTEWREHRGLATTGTLTDTNGKAYYVYPFVAPYEVLLEGVSNEIQRAMIWSEDWKCGYFLGTRYLSLQETRYAAGLVWVGTNPVNFGTAMYGYSSSRYSSSTVTGCIRPFVVLERNKYDKHLNENRGIVFHSKVTSSIRYVYFVWK